MPEGQPASALEATPLGATCVYSSVVAIDRCLGGAGLALLEGVAPLLGAHGKSGSMAPTREVSRNWLQSKASKG